MIASFLLIASSGIMYEKLKRQKAEINRLNANQRSLQESISFYRTKDSLSAASVEVLSLTINEYKRTVFHKDRLIDELGIKLRRLQSVSKTATQQTYGLEVVLIDSIVFTQGPPDTVKCINLSDEWIRARGCVQDGIFSGKLVTYDTLVQAVHRIPRRFLGIPFGTKAIRQEIVSKNPNSQITYTEFIELRRR